MLSLKTLNEYNPITPNKRGAVRTGGFSDNTDSESGCLSDDATVLRGGMCDAQRFTEGSGVTVTADGTLEGVSVQSGDGLTVRELSNGVRNGQVGTTTVGQIRALGGDVVPSPSPNSPYHCDMFGITADQAESLFTPTIRNPSH